MLLVELDHRTKMFEAMEKRIASRAIIRKRNLFFMIYIKKSNAYVFPGGGVEYGETNEEACIREALEEAGAVISIKNYIGCIDEMWDSKFGDLTYFLKSHYFECVLEDVQEQSLLGYEKEYGFTPVWISARDALRANLSITSIGEMRYLDRNNYLLKLLSEEIC